MTNLVHEYRELRRMIDELQEELDGIKVAIATEMTAAGVDTMTGTDWKATYKPINSSRFDTKAFRKDHAVMAEKYTKQTSSYRLTVS